jgi:hypothetical protein
MGPPKLFSANVHVYTAAMERRPIAVFLAEERIGTGYIEKVNESSVKVNGPDGCHYFLRANCTFYALQQLCSNNEAAPIRNGFVSSEMKSTINPH